MIIIPLLLVCSLGIEAVSGFLHFRPSSPSQQSTYPREISTLQPFLFSRNHGQAEQEIAQENNPGSLVSRRRVLGITAAFATTQLLKALAAEDDGSFIQRGNGFAFRFVPPPEMEAGAKPVKTHLFEINWKSQTTSKYTFGVTVDPVRIQNLKEFGTPEEVAAKVVLAEVNRDGIFEVTLVKDPVAVEEDGILSYILDYLSQGKRGDKRFVAKFCIQNQRLYALTAQVLEGDYKDKEEELLQAVKSFRVLPS